MLTLPSRLLSSLSPRRIHFSTPLRQPPCRGVPNRSLRFRSPVPRATEDAYEGPQLEPLELDSTGGLGGTSESVYGPLAILLVGFREPEYQSMQQLLDDINASMVELISCPSDGLTSTLEELITLGDTGYEEGPLGLRRVVFLSGMYASEVQEIISAYREAKLPDTLFAAYVPKNRDKQLTELIDEIYGDHEYMIARRLRERRNED